MSKYLTCYPTKEQLKAEIERQKTLFYLQHPKEVVRQKTIKFLMKRLGVPQNKIIVERSLNTLGVEGVKRRVDIGVLDKESLLMAVVECKASLLGIEEAAHIQAQNYLLGLNTRYFFVTDGSSFNGYYYDSLQYIRLEAIPKYDQWNNYSIEEEK